MGDTSVTKVSAAGAPRGRMGQKYLASGVGMSMRLWEAMQPGEPPPVTAVEATHPPAEAHSRDE